MNEFETNSKLLSHLLVTTSVYRCPQSSSSPVARIPRRVWRGRWRAGPAFSAWRLIMGNGTSSS